MPHISKRIVAPRDMELERIRNVFGRIAGRGQSLGIHATPFRFRRSIERKGLVHGEKFLDKRTNRPGIHFSLIRPTLLVRYIENLEPEQLINRAGATFADIISKAMRRGDRNFVVYLFDADRAFRSNGRHEIKMNRNGFENAVLIRGDDHNPIVPQKFLVNVEYGIGESGIVHSRAVELKERLRHGEAGKNGPKHFRSYLKFERTDIVMCMVLGLLEPSALP